MLMMVELGTDQDDDDMQSNINMIVKRCETWSVEFSPEQCKVMSFGKQLNPEDYFISEKNIDATECEKDLGILVLYDRT